MLRMTPKLLALAVTVALLLALTTICGAVQVNLISDIHLDPAYGTAKGYKCISPNDPLLGKAGCDSPKGLVDTVMADVSGQLSAFTIYGGDWQRHHFTESGLPETSVFSSLSESFKSINTSVTYPSPAFVGTLGNNDVVPDYTFEWNASTHPETDVRIDMMANEGLLTVAEATTMKKCGYYSHDVAGSDLTVISLHTLVWTFMIKPVVPDTEEDPCGQFDFLEKTVAKARAAGNKVIILSHIPPSMNVFQVIGQGKFKTEAEDMYWKPHFVQRYFSILSKNKDIIRVQFFGHTHFFTPLAIPESGVVAFILPAVSPVYANHPTYLLADFGPTWTLEDLRIRYLASNGTWLNGVRAVGALALPSGFGDVNEVQLMLSRMVTVDFLFDNYMDMYAPGENQATNFGHKCDAWCRAVMVCGMTYSAYDEIKTCAYNAMAPVAPPVNLSASVVTAVLMIGVPISVVIIFAMAHVIPRVRSGECSWDKIDYDWRHELLGETSRKEKARREAAATAAADDNAAERRTGRVGSEAVRVEEASDTAAASGAVAYSEIGSRTAFDEVPRAYQHREEMHSAAVSMTESRE